MSLRLPDLRGVAAALAIATVVLLAAAVSVASADDEISAARAESFSAARGKCARTLHQSCYAQRLRHVSRRCWVFRGVVTGRVGRTYGCPGSPLYVY